MSRDPWKYDVRRMKITAEVDIDPETGLFEEIEFPARFVVCPRCDGRGVHDHEAFENGITPEQFAEDPDFAEDYFRGAYDVQCSTCHGMRVALELDLDSMNEKTRKLAEQAIEQRDDLLNELAHERRMRSLGIEY